jgi:hypothetical protein
MKADDTVPAATSSWMTLAGYGLTGVSALFFLMDAGMKLMQLPIVLQTTAQLGWPTSSVVPLGMILLVSTLLYIFPRTSILGAVLLTGYLGGAVATHARIDSPLFTHTLFGVYVGVILWAGLYLRDPVLRSVFPARCLARANG